MKKKKLAIATLAVALSGLGVFSSMAYAKTGLRSSDFKITDAFQFADADDGVVSDAEAEKLPESVDLRERGVVTPVKLQSPFGDCWAFGSIAASETSILSEMGKTYEETGLDLSEKHLAWFAYQSLDDPYSSQNGEGFHFNRQTTTGGIYETGGLPFYAGGLFSQGVGPVLEEDYPYQGKNGLITRDLDDDGNLYDYTYSERDDWSIDNSERFKKKFTLQEDYIISTESTDDNGNYVYDERITNAVKKQINLGRGVAMTYYADTSDPDEEGNQEYLNKQNWCQYTDKILESNHGVCIVGYDDNYSRENFNEDHRPPGNGAYLVKNSWGSGENEFPNRGRGNWGIEKNGVHTGYFWLSYYDMSILEYEIFDFDLDKTGTDTEIIDQYDFASNSDVNSAVSKKDCHMINIFTAQYNQELREVSCVTGSPNVSVSYEVYLLDDNDNMTFAASAQDDYEYAGYHRIALNKAVKLSKGQRYGIYVTETNEDGQDEIILGYLKTNLDTSIKDNKNVYVKTIVNEGESYLKYDGTWYDWNDVCDAFNVGSSSGYDVDNFCIKGYSVLSDSTDISDRTVKLSQTSYTYTGLAKKPSVSIDGLTAEKDYTVSYSNNVNAGTARVTVTGKGLFTGSVTTYFSIVKKDTAPVLNKPVWKKMISGKKRITLTWKKQSGITGYQIQYSRKKSMKSSKKITIKSASTAKKTIKGLKAKRVYYARIRTYKTVNGKTYYSKWSAIKKRKTK